MAGYDTHHLAVLLNQGFERGVQQDRDFQPLGDGHQLRHERGSHGQRLASARAPRQRPPHHAHRGPK